MKKLKSSLTNMVLVLTGIAIIAGGLLAYVNAVTAPKIEEINAQNLSDGIKAVMGGGDVSVESTDTVTATIDDKEKTFVVYDVAGLGKAVQTSENGFGGELKVLVGFDNEGTIQGYTILQHAETPGLGAKAGLWFQKENGEKRTVVGKNPGQCNFTVSKDGGDIDAITASTITSRAFLKTIANAYNQIFANGGTAASTGASKKAASNDSIPAEAPETNEPVNTENHE